MVYYTCIYCDSLSPRLHKVHTNSSGVLLLFLCHARGLIWTRFIMTSRKHQIQGLICPSNHGHCFTNNTGTFALPLRLLTLVSAVLCLLCQSRTYILINPICGWTIVIDVLPTTLGIFSLEVCLACGSAIFVMAQRNFVHCIRCVLPTNLVVGGSLTVTAA